MAQKSLKVRRVFQTIKQLRFRLSIECIRRAAQYQSINAACPGPDLVKVSVKLLDRLEPISEPVLFMWHHVTYVVGNPDLRHEVLFFTLKGVFRLNPITIDSEKNISLTISSLLPVSIGELCAYEKSYPQFGEIIARQFEMFLWRIERAQRP